MDIHTALTNLICIQDSITHLNENSPRGIYHSDTEEDRALLRQKMDEHRIELNGLIAERNSLREEIVKAFDEMRGDGDGTVVGNGS